MTTTILANWKSTKTMSEASHWLQTFLHHYKPNQDLNIIIAPPTPYLATLKHILTKTAVTGISLAVQDISPFPTGSYTGAVAADMLAGLVRYALVGHSERRTYFHESHTDIARKVAEAQSAGITPILCLDMPYARTQLAALDPEALDQELLIGYTPVAAVNLEIPQLPEEQQENILTIKKMAPGIPILYGGSIRRENKADYLKLAGISGLMVGSSCLDPEEFAEICKL